MDSAAVDCVPLIKGNDAGIVLLLRNRSGGGGKMKVWML